MLYGQVFISLGKREQFAITSRMSVTLSESMTRVSSRTGRRKDGLSLIIWDIEWCQLQLCPSKTLTRKKECHGNRRDAETSDQDTDIFFHFFHFEDYYYYHLNIQFYFISSHVASIESNMYCVHHFYSKISIDTGCAKLEFYTNNFFK